MGRWLTILFFLFRITDLSADRGQDSLRAIISTSTNDSVKILAYTELLYGSLNDPDKALELMREWNAFCSKLTNKRHEAFCLRRIGALYYKLGYYDKSLEYGFKAAELSGKLNDQSALANCYNNIGNIYNAKGELTKDQKFFDRAIEYHKKCLDIRLATNDTLQLKNSYNNIGNAYMSKGDYDKAISYYMRSYEYFKNDPPASNGIDMITLNLGDVYLRKAMADHNPENFKKSLYYLQNRLDIYKDQGATDRHADALLRVGQIYCETGRSKEGIENMLKAYDMSVKLKHKTLMVETAKALADIYKEKGEAAKALEYLNTFIVNRDSLLNEKNSENIEQMQALYQSSQKDHEIQKLNADKEIQNEKLNRQRIAIFSTIGGLVLILVLGFVLLSRYNLKKKANRQLSDAYGKIELKNRQITDSINYARRIQNSILPPNEELKRYLPSFFVFYAPKDIVSGDFYWFSRTQGCLFFVVADCTGHGVPGALMSMIGNTLLNEIINQKKILDPGEILFHLNKGVSAALRQQEKDKLTQDDGMDISICCISESDHTKMKYATANHSIFVKHNNTVKELTGDIFSIGGSIGGHSEEHRQFETHEVALEKNSFVIMSTDGYYDQFGGASDSKFLVTKFEELIRNTDLDHDAASAFKNALESWKGSQKQTDDILVVGFKV